MLAKYFKEELPIKTKKAQTQINTEFRPFQSIPIKSKLCQLCSTW